MAAGDLTTLAAYKVFVGKTDTNSDALVSTLITAASDWIQTICDRSFTAVATVNEIRDGNGNGELFLRSSPVAAIQSLAVNALAIPAQTADGQPGYYLVDNVSIALQGYTFTRGRKNVRITYTSGYSAVPVAIAQACNELVQATLQRGARGGGEVSGKSLPASGEHYSFKLEDTPIALRRILQAYSRVVPA